MQGQSLNSRYRILEYIAKGGFGKTYLAEDTQLPGKDKCVVKQLYPSVEDPNFTKIARRLFKTEAETLHNLGSHNQIPRLLAYFEEDEKFYLVQQYIEGHTLTQELEEGKPWSENRVIELLRDCLGILSFIHGENVIHRDVKPDNLIRRSSDGKLVLVDFGTVKEIIAEQTQLIPATVAVGTRGYMPTEQARGKPRTTSDLYALGIVAIQALTGIHPIKLPENDNGELVWQDKTSCSPQLKEIVAKMTRYHFKERYQNAGKIVAALDGIEPSNIPQTEAVPYSPTVQLSQTQVANLAGKPVTPPPAQDPSILATPQNPTNFSPASPEPSLNPRLSSIAEPSSIEQENNAMPKQKSGRTLITLGAALALGAIATGGMYYLNQQSAQTTQANLDGQVADFKAAIAQQDYQSCYDTAVQMQTQTDGNNSSAMPVEQLKEFEAECGLALARAAATNLEYGEAVAIAKTLPQNTSLQAEIQQSTDNWSQQLLQQATQVYEREGNLEAAIELTKQIPQNSTVRAGAIDAREAWKAEVQQNESIIFTAEKALREENWQDAKQEATKIDDSASLYWQERSKAVVQQAEEGIAATAPQPEVPETIPETTPVQSEPSEPANVAPPKAIEPKQPPKTITEPTQPTPLEDLRDLSGDDSSSPELPSSPPANEDLRDL